MSFFNLYYTYITNILQIFYYCVIVDHMTHQLLILSLHRFYFLRNLKGLELNQSRSLLAFDLRLYSVCRCCNNTSGKH
jgi:hypothetical protein